MSGEWPSAVAAGWHPVALLSELGNRPLAARLMGMPLVVFAGEKGPVVLADRCPHRAMPLSKGRVEGGAIICPYHGWRFGEGGRCLAVPGTDSLPTAAARALTVRVEAGLVWTSLADEPGPFPRLAPEMEDDRLDTFWWAPPPADARLLDAIENHLDPAHPHYLHPWIVRSPSKRREVRVRLRLGPDGGEAIYDEDAQASALMPRIMEGRRLRSIGRYFPPTIGQVAFEGRKGLTLAITVIFSPEDHGRTRPFAHFATPKGVLPRWFKRLALIGFHVPVLRQDKAALAEQAANIARFGGADYAIGPLDFLGPTIWRLANGKPQKVEEREEIVWL